MNWNPITGAEKIRKRTRHIERVVVRYGVRHRRVVEVIEQECKDDPVLAEAWSDWHGNVVKPRHIRHHITAITNSWKRRAEAEAEDIIAERRLELREEAWKMIKVARESGDGKTWGRGIELLMKLDGIAAPTKIHFSGDLTTNNAMEELEKMLLRAEQRQEKGE